MKAETGQTQMGIGWNLRPFLWILGPILYLTGVVLSLLTDNLVSFLIDYPWACLLLAYTIGTWVLPPFGERHERATRAIRNAFLVSDKEFDEIVSTNMARLNRLRNLVFGLIFLPIMLWAWTQRLWWLDYNNPIIFDLYYLILVAFVLPAYAGIIFGAVVACHLNIHRLCERIPINPGYLLEEGRPIIRKLWGALIARVTVVAFIMSALTNVPILFYSGEIRSFLNLGLALTLTIVIFILPHYLFHRMLRRAKDEIQIEILEHKKKLGPWQLNGFASEIDDQETLRMLNLVYLNQYEWNMKAKSTWLVDLKAVTELLVVAAMHFILLEVLTLLTHL
ncbi:MAG: hypothetical protein ACXADD_18925 [Candidatus Thorarchaeota archaeon]|jgi:hypothetical protein